MRVYAHLTACTHARTHTHAQGRDKDPTHRDCVLVKCKEDPRTFFFDIEQVRVRMGFHQGLLSCFTNFFSLAFRVLSYFSRHNRQI
jgi:hypothetical protein